MKIHLNKKKNKHIIYDEKVYGDKYKELTYVQRREI